MAPRWRMATRTFFRGLGASAAYTALPSQAGAAPVPNIATADDFKSRRRVSMCLPPLKVRRSHDHSRDQAPARLLRYIGVVVEAVGNRIQRLLVQIRGQKLVRQCGRIVWELL